MPGMRFDRLPITCLLKILNAFVLLSDFLSLSFKNRLNLVCVFQNFIMVVLPINIKDVISWIIRIGLDECVVQTWAE